MNEIEHHEHSAQCAREMATTHRAYLDWSTDPAQRQWAEQVAHAYDLIATAEQSFADALRERVPS